MFGTKGIIVWLYHMQVIGCAHHLKLAAKLNVDPKNVSDMRRRSRDALSDTNHDSHDESGSDCDECDGEDSTDSSD